MILSNLNSMLIRYIIFRLHWFKGKQNYLSILSLLTWSTLQIVENFSRDGYVRRSIWLMGCFKDHAMENKLDFEI